MKSKAYSYLVNPAEKTNPRRTISVSVVDTLYEFPRYNSTVHIYRSGVGSDSRGFFDVGVLRESLSKTLVQFYSMAGRFCLDQEGTMGIDCNDEGVVFVHVERDSDVDELGDLKPSSELKSLLPYIDLNQPLVTSYPLMAVQVTYFKCGAVSLGISMEHTAVDGCSAFHLINSWAETCRGVPISVQPYLERALLLRPRDPPRPKFDHLEYTRYTVCKPQTSRETKTSVVKLTKDQLIQMKAKANYSTFEILAAHTWKCVCKARQVSSDQPSRLLFQVNGRFRLDPPLPPGFLGNAIFRTSAVVGTGDLQSKPLQFLAGKIREASRRVDDEYMRSIVDFLATRRDPSEAKIGPHNFEIPNFQVTSWARIGLNDANFGWGPPEYSGPGEVNFEKAYIFSGDSSGGLSVAITLQPQHLEKFEKLFYEFE